MNPKQEIIGKKILKNTAHGKSDVDIKNILQKEFRLPMNSSYKFYSNFVNILQEIYNKDKPTKLIRFVSGFPEVNRQIKNTSMLTTKFVNFCLRLLNEHEQKYEIDEKSGAIQRVKEKKDDVPITDKVPTNPSESEEKEISN